MRSSPSPPRFPATGARARRGDQIRLPGQLGGKLVDLSLMSPSIFVVPRSPLTARSGPYRVTSSPNQRRVERARAPCHVRDRGRPRAHVGRLAVPPPSRRAGPPRGGHGAVRVGPEPPVPARGPRRTERCCDRRATMSMSSSSTAWRRTPSDRSWPPAIVASRRSSGASTSASAAAMGHAPAGGCTPGPTGSPGGRAERSSCPARTSPTSWRPPAYGTRRYGWCRPAGTSSAAAGSPSVGDLRAGRQAAVLCVANWLPRKGIIALLDAVALLPPDAVTLHLVGDEATEPAYRRAVLDRLARSDLRDRVERHGIVPNEHMAALYDRADVFALPSTEEPYGIVYGEAMAAGLPVVGWRAGNLPSLVDDGVEGRTVPDRRHRRAQRGDRRAGPRRDGAQAARRGGARACGEPPDVAGHGPPLLRRVPGGRVRRRGQCRRRPLKYCL